MGTKCQILTSRPCSLLMAGTSPPIRCCWIRSSGWPGRSCRQTERPARLSDDRKRQAARSAAQADPRNDSVGSRARRLSPGQHARRRPQTLVPSKLRRSAVRLFFRYNAAARIVIFAWVNDRDTLRTYGSETDAYAVFRAVLDKGNPPDDWDALVAAAATEAAGVRRDALLGAP